MLNFSTAKWIKNDTILPFARVGYAENAGLISLLETYINASVAFHVSEDKDLFAIGTNWGNQMKWYLAKDEMTSLG